MSTLMRYVLLLLTTNMTGFVIVGHSMSTWNVSILLLSTTAEECHTDVINSAVQKAIHLLNSKEQGIRMSTVIRNLSCQERCTWEEAQNAFFSAILNKADEVAIIGPACSTVSDSISWMAHYYQIPVVSLAPFHSESNYSFNIVPSLTQLMNGTIEFVEVFPEWQRAAIISQDEEVFRKMAVLLEQAFTFSVRSSKVISRALSYRDINVNKLVDNSTRVIILNMESMLVRAFLCKASFVIHHPYVWIVPSSQHESWWLHENQFCADDQLHNFLNKQGVLLIRGLLNNSTCNSSIPLCLLEYFNGTQDENVLTSLAYDSVFTIALGLNATNRTLTQLEDDDSTCPGSVSSIGKVLTQHISKTTFHGYSANVCFNNGRRDVDTIQVLQFRKANGSIQLKNIGMILLKEGIYFHEMDRESIWESGIPSDGSPVTEKKFPNFVLTVVTYIFAGGNILTAFAGILFMFVFRRRRVIRISSPNLNYLVGIGVIILSSATFLFVYPSLPISTINTFCVVRPWFISLGYSLCLGTINTKMWRVYYICRNAKASAKKKPIKDWHLFLFVVLFVIADIIILTFATSFQTSRQQATVIPDVENSNGGVNENGIEVEYEVITCDARYRLQWLVPLLGYKIVFHVVGVFLAFKIRKVKVKVLNDSKEVVLVLYLTGVVLGAVIITTLAFRSYLNVYTGAYAVGICVTGAVILAVVFIFKAIYLWKDPKGRELFPTTANNANTAVSVAHNPPTEMSEIATLQRKVKTLEAQLTTTVEEADVKTDCVNNNSVTFTVKD